MCQAELGLEAFIHEVPVAYEVKGKLLSHG